MKYNCKKLSVLFAAVMMFVLACPVTVLAAAEEEAGELPSEEPVEFSKLPKGMVLMTSDSLGVMHDDVICLTEGLDVMVALLRAVMAGCPMKKEDVESVVNMTSDMSEEAEMIELD